VNHEEDPVASTRESLDPSAEWEIHRTVSVSVRDPLNQDGAALVQQGICAGEVVTREVAECTVKNDAVVIESLRLALMLWRENFNRVARQAELMREQACVVADASSLWRIFAGDDLPVHPRA
jgi:hypothetical protein